MNDAAGNILAQRREFDSDFGASALASVLVHGALATALLLGFRSGVDRSVAAAPTFWVPTASITGTPLPGQGPAAVRPQTILKPPAPPYVRTSAALPSAGPAQALTPPVGASPLASADQASSGPVVLGSSDAPTPYAWYLASVQAKVWMLWANQVHSDFTTPVEVEFVILEDGSLANTPVVKSSGSRLLELAAMRAIVSAAPFAPLPEGMQMSALTIRAHFKPER